MFSEPKVVIPGSAPESTGDAAEPPVSAPEIAGEAQAQPAAVTEAVAGLQPNGQKKRPREEDALDEHATSDAVAAADRPDVASVRKKKKGKARK